MPPSNAYGAVTELRLRLEYRVRGSCVLTNIYTICSIREILNDDFRVSFKEEKESEKE